MGDHIRGRVWKLGKTWWATVQGVTMAHKFDTWQAAQTWAVNKTGQYRGMS